MKSRITLILMALLLAVPFAAAQEAANETVVIQGGSEYKVMERAIDRIKLAFALQAERKLELINKIQEKREQHYQFLIAKGKAEQAERFRGKTIGLVKNFEQWKAQKQEIIAKLGQTQKTAEKGAEKAKSLEKLPKAQAE